MFPCVVARTGSCVSPQPSLCLRSHPWSTGLCRLLSAPAGRRTFPTLSLRLFPYVLGPLPRRLVWCSYPFLPTRQRPSPREDRVGAPQCPYSDFSTAPIARLQSFADVQARRFARHPGRSYRHKTPCGSRGFSIRASHGLLPPRAPDMLTVRIGQLTVWGLSPHQIRSLVGCSPNARRQARLKAGATQERTLEAVACTPKLGGGHADPSRSKARNPACWKCSSVVRASVSPRSSMTRNETQSVSPHSLSGRAR